MQKKIGLTIADTLITNNPNTVKEFLKSHNGKVIFKSLTSEMETRPLREEFLSSTPTDRGKLRSNRCILTDQDGIPLSIARNAKGSFESCSLSNFLSCGS